MEARFIEPLDVLFLRGNKLFGDPGSHGEALIPPWPSVVAGAIRSRMLADDSIDFARFARSEIEHETLGTPGRPGSFSVVAFHLARRKDGRVEPIFALPADLSVAENGTVRRLSPVLPSEGIVTSCPTPLLPVLAEERRAKPATGSWLSVAGWRKYLAGATPVAEDLVKGLWKLDPRVGIGVDSATGGPEDGKLFTVQAVALDRDVGFLALVAGAIPPYEGTLRFGGDGRGAAIAKADVILPRGDHAAIARAGRCRIVLTAPGLFPEGWRLPGSGGQGNFDLCGVKARVAAVALPRADIVSGFDIARLRPKPAQRVAPTGSVYWLDGLSATPDALDKLVTHGLWSEPCEDEQRRAEGFNRIAIAAW